MADRLGAMRGPGERYSDAILRMVEMNRAAMKKGSSDESA